MTSQRQQQQQQRHASRRLLNVSVRRFLPVNLLRVMD